MLVDTSVWVQHLRLGQPALAARLQDGTVECHPFVIGELACGQLTRRREILELLAALPQVTIAEHAEVLAFVDRAHLAGCGTGWVDAHLLCSALLHGTQLWTLDRRLATAARKLAIAFEF